MSSYDHCGLIPGTLRSLGLALGEPDGDMKLSSHPSRESTINSLTEIHHRSSGLKNTWGIREGDFFTNFIACAGGPGIFGRFLQEQKNWWVPLPSPDPPILIKAHPTLILFCGTACPLQLSLCRSFPGGCRFPSAADLAGTAHLAPTFSADLPPPPGRNPSKAAPQARHGLIKASTTLK